MTIDKEQAEMLAALAAPFEPAEIKWKPQAVKGDRALAIAYVDARVIMDRLDDVLGVAGWQDEYELAEGGSVICRLKVWAAGQWLCKQDVGSPSEQPDDGDKMKAAFSDALKRAAVKYGLGRYLYRLPHQWCDYDPKRRTFVRTPQLPAHALPQAPAKAPRPEPAPASAATPAARKGKAGEDMTDLVEELLEKMGACESKDKLKRVAEEVASYEDRLTEPERAQLREYYAIRKAEIEAARKQPA